MKSAKLYEHLRKENILSLPSKTTLRKYLKSYKTGFGFCPKIFNVVSEKTATMEEYACHGGIIVDEMKLSEHLSVTTAGHIDGFVDLGKVTSPKDKHTPCDHGMILIFVPFAGKWTQILAAFATRGNVNGGTLTKIILEAIILAEKAGLKVDFITSDGASWNIRMWTLMGIKASLDEIKCSAPHPVDEHRQLYFMSDFPYLLKCLRNWLLSLDFQTPKGQVTMRAVRKALELDGSNVTLQAMHGITSSHTNPNNFEKMRVSLAFQLFSEKAPASTPVNVQPSRLRSVPRKTVEMALALGVFFAVTLLVGVLVAQAWMPHPPHTDPFCHSDECLSHARLMESKLDLAVDPCEDFNAYACASWEPPSECYSYATNVANLAVDN
ncbi:hypothetical protein HPB49_014205 [Dermacentor silvarum]|uniref:Uncharacterized protein n=1 Tax=Dermacentor silvarum TaxID=543639 RepID=A0ACB8E0U4_DERSI|nr:hypothetical protein HPB49_014205 [Dermacentor silvarum]